MKFLTLMIVVLGFVSFSHAVDPPTTAPAVPAPTEAPKSDKPKHYDAPPPMTIDVAKKYTAIIETSKGNVILDLFAKDAPGTVNNFIFLAKDHYYDGIIFHRVISDFMIQGGDPTGTGAGGPGYTIKDEVENNPRMHVTGALSMAKTQVPDSGGSQFFITHVPAPHLDGLHTVFGQVREGQDVVNKIVKGDVIKTIKIEESK